ncbi:MAG: hypothetical protein ACPGVN_01935 [Alphaproteobacteria bacterium]
MRLLSAVFLIIAIVFIVWFTASNQQPQTLSLLKINNAMEYVGADMPSDQLTLPAYIWGFIIFILGLFSGIFATFITGGKARSKKRELKRNLKSTKKDLVKREKEIARIKEADENIIDPVALIQRS